MTQIFYRDRLCRLLALIGSKQARSVAFVARRMECCERTVKYLVARLRKEGHDIRYDKALKRYVLLKKR